MRTLKTTSALFIFGSIISFNVGANQPFTGAFEGTGRACFGALYVRTKTIEWNSTYSVCKKTQYDIIEKNVEVTSKRIVFNLKKTSRQCRYKVVEVEHVSDYSWNVTGYQSLEGFEKRDLPDWKNSPLDERQTLSCTMIALD